MSADLDRPRTSGPQPHELRRTLALVTGDAAACSLMVGIGEMVLGSSLGGALLHRLGETRGAYRLLFALSSSGRLLALPLLARIPAARARGAPAVAAPRPSATAVR